MTEKTKVKFITRVLLKPDVQQMLKALRKAGLNVEQVSMGYPATTKNGTEIFRAMNGRRNYLVRMAHNLFV